MVNIFIDDIYKAMNCEKGVKRNQLGNLFPVKMITTVCMVHGKGVDSYILKSSVMYYDIQKGFALKQGKLLIHF